MSKRRSYYSFVYNYNRTDDSIVGVFGADGSSMWFGDNLDTQTLGQWFMGAPEMQTALEYWRLDRKQDTFYPS